MLILPSVSLNSLINQKPDTDCCLWRTYFHSYIFFSLKEKKTLIKSDGRSVLNTTLLSQLKAEGYRFGVFRLSIRLEPNDAFFFYCKSSLHFRTYWNHTTALVKWLLNQIQGWLDPRIYLQFHLMHFIECSLYIPSIFCLSEEVLAWADPEGGQGVRTHWKMKYWLYWNSFLRNTDTDPPLEAIGPLGSNCFSMEVRTALY